MFVAIAYFPPIKEGKETEFQDWFEWSNEEFSKQKGFMRRRLMRAQEDGAYVALLEYESYEDFKAMAESPAHIASSERVMPLLDGTPKPVKYDVVIDTKTEWEMASA